MRPLADQTILITGATDGLGKALAAELAATGARLLLHGRDDRKGADTVREIQHRTRNGQVHWYRRLEPLLRRSAPARVVNVASAGQEPIDFSDVMLERGYDGVRAYRQSKLALVMYTFDLAAELAGSGVTVNCLHPATFMPTKMVIGHTKPRSSVEDGLRATMRLIVRPALEAVTGRYYDGLLEATASAQAYDQDARQQLQKLSDQLTGPFSSN